MITHAFIFFLCVSFFLQRSRDDSDVNRNLAKEILDFSKILESKHSYGGNNAN